MPLMTWATHVLQWTVQRVAILLVASIKLGTLVRLPVTNRRTVGTTSDHHAPYDLGYTRATMDGTTRSEPAKASGSLKAVLS